MGRLLHNRVAVGALAFLVLLVLVALLAPWLAPHDPDAQDLLARLQPPSGAHWLGTDSLGRDDLSRLLVGTRLTLTAVVEAVALAVLLGIPLGLVAGYVGGWVDAVLGWASDVLLSLPPLFLALAIVGILGPGLTDAMIALAVVFAPGFYRVARSASIAMRSETYVEAARSIGWSTPQILWRHVLPNASGPLLVQITFALGLTVVAEASLSFLGLGAAPPAATWGSMLDDAFKNVYTATFPLYAPAITIALTILAAALLGDALRDAVGRPGRRA